MNKRQFGFMIGSNLNAEVWFLYGTHACTMEVRVLQVNASQVICRVMHQGMPVQGDSAASATINSLIYESPKPVAIEVQIQSAGPSTIQPAVQFPVCLMSRHVPLVTRDAAGNLILTFFDVFGASDEDKVSWNSFVSLYENYLSRPHSW